MELQTLLNVGVATSLSLIGWFGRQIWEAVQNLKEDIHRIEVELPIRYIRKEDFNDTMKKIEYMLEKIFEKLDHKVDK